MSTTIDVDGVGCDGCEESVEEALVGVPGVRDAGADRENGVTTVEGDAAVFGTWWRPSRTLGTAPRPVYRAASGPRGGPR